MTIAELPGLTIVELQRLLRAREIAPCEILQALHERIENVEPQIAAYLSRDLDAAIADAENADVNLSLGGIPLAIKDVISVEDQPCTCGSKILHNYRALYDATAIARLKTAGAIPFGKTNLDEFRHGFVDRKLKHRPEPKSLGRDSDSRRFERWFNRGGGSGCGNRGPRFRYRWFDSTTGRAVRRGWPEADVWPGLALWLNGIRIVARSD
jgi:hypothetical protein